MKGSKLTNYLKDQNITSISAYSKIDKISEATARRRLSELQDAGYISLSRGGTFKFISELEISPPDTLKQKEVGIDKQLSSQIAASQVKDGDVIFIDNGTTVREMIKHLESKNVVIYTNGIYHMLNNQNVNININIIPGELLVKEASIVGAEAISYLSTLHIDKAFIGANGYDESGVYTPHRREMLIKEFALRHATNGYLVLTESKYQKKSKYKICDPKTYHLITEKTI